jgi:hypothetical protein
MAVRELSFNNATEAGVKTHSLSVEMVDFAHAKSLWQGDKNLRRRILAA